MNHVTDASAFSLLACDEGFDPIEDRLRTNICGVSVRCPRSDGGIECLLDVHHR